MAEPLDYYDQASLSAVFYDALTRLDPTTHADCEVYTGMVPPGGSALDLGCGTGRVAFSLAARGVEVVGVDLARPMLDRAALRARSLPPEVAARATFVQGDMTRLSLGRRFDIVLVAFFGLAHLPPARWGAAFEVMAGHVIAAGTVAVHLPDPVLMAAPAGLDPAKPVVEFPYNAQGESLALYLVGQSFDGERFEQLLDYVLRSPGGAETRRSRERITYYGADPTPFAAAAGLEPAAAPQRVGAGEIHRFRPGPA